AGCKLEVHPNCRVRLQIYARADGPGESLLLGCHAKLARVEVHGEVVAGIVGPGRPYKVRTNLGDRYLDIGRHRPRLIGYGTEYLTFEDLSAKTAAAARR